MSETLTLHLPRPTSTASSRLQAAKPYALWAAQIAVALIFLFAGSMKFVMPIEDMQQDNNLPAWFFRFIGTCEVLGGLGLLLPGILRVRRGLTPLAASGLVIIMIGATTLTVATMGIAPALFPFAVGLLALCVVRGRWSWFTAA